MVDQIIQIPSKISMLCLLLISEAHIESLLKILSKTHVTKDIPVAKFDGVVANITASTCLGFSSKELPQEE